MMHSGSRLRQIGWVVALSICTIIFAVLTFRVNAVKSDVRLAEREIIALEREKMVLETEFQTRANQQQLANWNRVEFGYKAPSADQYLENERQLASLGLPRNTSAPNPIRVARAPVGGEETMFPDLVSPLTGRPIGENAVEQPASRSMSDKTNEMSAKRSLSERLTVKTSLSGAMAEVSE